MRIGRIGDKGARNRATKIIVCVSLSLPFLAVTSPIAFSADPGWTESELVLSGLKLPDSVETAPDQLVIPDVWLNGMRAMLDNTTKTNKEVSACLGETADNDVSERMETMAAYADLFHRRASMDAKTFDVKERDLRHQIEDAGATTKSGKHWTMGGIQEGDNGSTPLEVSGVHCTGEAIADVHTHPPHISVEALSDTDFLLALEKDHLHSSFVLYEGRMCGVVKTKRTRHDMSYAQRETLEGVFAQTSAATSPVFKLGLDPAAGARAGLAASAEQADEVVYCGTVGEPLKRVEPMQLDLANQWYFAYAAVLLYLHDRTHGGDLSDALDFSDPKKAFYRELDRTKWLSAADVAAYRAPDMAPGQIYAKIMLRARRQAGSASMDLAGFTIPDERESPDVDSRSFVCGEAGCVIIDGSRIWKKPVHRFVTYFFEQGRTVVERDDDGLRMFRQSPESTYIGPCAFDKAGSCQPKGVGKYTDLKTGNVFKVQSVPGQSTLKVLERLK